jgi:hypothetical protein
MSKAQKKGKKKKPSTPSYDQIQSLYYNTDGPDLIIDKNFKKEVSDQFFVYRNLESALFNKIPGPHAPTGPGGKGSGPADPKTKESEGENLLEIYRNILKNKANKIPGSAEIEEIEVSSSLNMTDDENDLPSNPPSMQMKIEFEPPNISKMEVKIEFEPQPPPNVQDSRIKIESEPPTVPTPRPQPQTQVQDSRIKVEEPPMILESQTHQIQHHEKIAVGMQNLESQSIVQPNPSCNSNKEISILEESCCEDHFGAKSVNMSVISRPLGIKRLIKKSRPNSNLHEQIETTSSHIKKFMSYYKSGDKKKKEFNKKVADKKAAESKVDDSKPSDREKTPSEFTKTINTDEITMNLAEEGPPPARQSLYKEKEKEVDNSKDPEAQKGGTAVLNLEIDKNLAKISQKLQLMSMDIEKDNVLAKKSFNFHYAANDVIIEEILQFKKTMRRAFPHLRRQIHREINREIKIFDYEFPLNSSFLNESDKELLHFAPKDFFHFKFIKHIRHDEAENSYLLELDDRDPFKFLVADYVENLKYLIEWLNSLGDQSASNIFF